MNKLWIEHSRSDAEMTLDNKSSTKKCKGTRSDYLNVIGLFETDWMIVHLDPDHGYMYGYPK